jgi:hypothetical protein
LQGNSKGEKENSVQSFLNESFSIATDIQHKKLTKKKLTLTTNFHLESPEESQILI